MTRGNPPGAVFTSICSYNDPELNRFISSIATLVSSENIIPPLSKVISSKAIQTEKRVADRSLFVQYILS